MVESQKISFLFKNTNKENWSLKVNDKDFLTYMELKMKTKRLINEKLFNLIEI